MVSRIDLMFGRCLLLSLFCFTALIGCGDGAGDKPSGEVVSVSVSGTVMYEDREYSHSGFTGATEDKSVRYAVVDLVDGQGNVVDTTTTDENGVYTLSGNGSNLYVRVLALTGSDAGAVVEVSSYSGNIYAVKQTVLEDGDNVTMNFDIRYEDKIAGAFNILDVYTNASLFVSQLSTSTLPTLKVHWQPASSRYGTYFCQSDYFGGACPQGKGIYLLGGSSSGGDTDEYDDDVLYHEYGHYLESVYGVQDSPGGRHYLTDNDLDLRLAWSEGIAGFFPGAVKTWLADNNPERLSSHSGMNATYFIDTVGTMAAISIDMANPSPMFCLWSVDCFVYSSSEVAVAKVLHQLRDRFGMQAVWSAFSGYMPVNTPYPATIEAFWDGWVAQRSPGEEEMETLHGIFEDRLIFYQQDQFEPDDDHDNVRKLEVCTTSNCSGEVHYLYNRQGSNDDVDLIAFDGQMGKSYIVETFDLSNGADTYIRVLDSMQNVVVDSNSQTMVNNDRPGTVYCYTYDNPCRVHNDSVMLSSSLFFAPMHSKTYFIEVKTPPTKSAVAGRYGTYSLRVIEQQ